MKTAYIELNGTSQINSLSKKKAKPAFTYKGIVFYPDTSVTSLSEILHMNYDFFILDLGVLNAYNINEFLRCDKPFLICSPSKWRYSQTKEKIEKTFQNLPYQHCTVLVNLCEKESIFTHFLESCEHLSFPYITNPFQLGTNCFHKIYRILKI